MAARRSLRFVERAIGSDAAAKEAYDGLLANGLKSTDRLKEFLGMAVVTLKGNAAKRRLVAGKTKKTIAYFPKRLILMADEIKRLNADPLFTPDPQDLLELPETIRRYAEHVQNRRGLQKNRKGKPNTMGQILMCLRWLVRQETGKKSLVHLDKLLSAVANAAKARTFDFAAVLKANSHRYPIPY